MITDDMLRFWSKVNKNTPNGCWEWQGLKHPFGYGRITFNRKQYLAHRLSYELHLGPIGNKSICVCHQCDNPLCVNPSHLFLGSRKDNNLDRNKKGRTFKGSEVTNSKLTESQVLEIRQSSLSVKQLSLQYSVTTASIYAIKSRTNWRHL